MRSFHVGVVLAGLALWTPQGSAAQDADRQASSTGVGSGAGTKSTGTMTTGQGTSTVTAKKPGTDNEPPLGRWVRTLTNVQVELTITDQTGTATPEKKTVTMVVSSGSWGKIRSAQMLRSAGGSRDEVVDLNVDARPLVSVDGPIQLELTVVYSPPGAQTGDVVRVRPTGVNQSLTVILQSGKPLVISQAADPVGDRKIIVEAKATVLN